MLKYRKILVLALAVLTFLAVSAAAMAHSRVEVDNYKMVFGGSDEPVITGERTWLVLNVTDLGGNPVKGVEKTLKLIISHLEHEKELDLSAVHGQPGSYKAAVLFTAAGTYTIHTEGTIDGTEIHTHFEKQVDDVQELAFPG